MSHLSRISTRIFDLEILKKTIEDLGFYYKSREKYKDANNNYYDLDLVIFSDVFSNEPLFGFIYSSDQQEYLLAADIAFWDLGITIECFIEKLHQSYALNIVLQQSILDGFQSLSKVKNNDGSLKLVVQRWCS